MGKRRRRFQFCIRGFQSVRRLFLQLSDSRLAPAQTPARHGGGRQRARPRGACGGGGDGEIMAGSKSFLQAFPNLRLFSPSFSKESFGGFVEFQRVTRVPKFQTQKAPFPNFSLRPPPFGLVPKAVAPHSADSAVAIRVCSAVRRVAGLRGARSGLI